MARMYRFFLRNSTITPGDFDLNAQSEPEIIFQLSTVLRAKAGDNVVLLNNGNTTECKYSVLEANKHHVKLEFMESKKNENELDFELNILICLPNKPDKLDFILQKAVELGATGITLLESDFSQMKHHLKPERIQKILIEAAEQSERAKITDFIIGGKLDQYLKKHAHHEQILVAMERMNKNTNTYELFKDQIKKYSSISLLIGPEGGFSEKEKNLINDLQLNCFSLGKRVLRMETAMIASAAIISILEK